MKWEWKRQRWHAERLAMCGDLPVQLLDVLCQIQASLDAVASTVRYGPMI